MRAREFLKEKVSSNVSNLQQDINSKVNTIFDVDELNKIHAYIRRLDIGSGFDDIFEQDVDLKQVQGYLSKAINEAPGSVQEKINFAKELVTKGVISLENLFVPDQNLNIMDAVVTEYPEIFNAVAPTLLNISGSFSAGGVKTNKGKGEFFLALVHPLITLSKGAGDVVVNGMPVEVKANLSRIKGRKGYGTTDTAIKDVESAVNDFLKNNIKNPQITIPSFSSYLGPRATLWSQFGPFCIQNGVNPETVVEFLRKQLTHIVKSLYLNLDDTYLNSILGSIKINGVMDPKEFVQSTQIAAFEYYRASDNFKGIFFINGDTMDCVYIENSASFADIINVAKWGYEPGQQNGLQIRV